MSIRFLVQCSVAAAALVVAAPALSAEPCAALAALKITNTKVISAAPIHAGPYAPEQRSGGRTGPAREFPAFCRVSAVANPVPDSEIHLEVWLPPPGAWNGKFMGIGNGGYSGDLGYAGMEAALRGGFATASSDTGHAGNDIRFGAGHPEKIADWAHRAIHVMTETAKLVVRNYYGRFPQYSYFAGCSTGGQQALMEAQRYPDDYDGIAAGAPGNSRVHLNIGFLWSWLALNRNPAASLPVSKLVALNRAAVDACDANDGLRDGLVTDPLHCEFDPGPLICSGADNSECLTRPQLEAVRQIYGGARNPRTGEQLFAGWAPGSEADADQETGGWASYFVGKPEPARLDFWRYWVFENPQWDPMSFDFDRDAAYAIRKLGYIEAASPDLSAFSARNGKLLIYAGGADPVVPPADTARYFERLQELMGPEKTAGFARFYIAPGMAHCGGGAGPNTFDYMGALERWVIQGTAPERIVASHSKGASVDRTRPLCPYPQIAKWSGQGSQDDEAQFECVRP
jgi:feruloyl esterase